MGVSINIIPIGPGETPEWAIARVYGGPEHILWMQGYELDGTNEELPPLAMSSDPVERPDRRITNHARRAGPSGCA